MGNNLKLKFGEMFPGAFKKRIENGAGPLLAVKQNHPGVLHCTESGFNPDFTPVTRGQYGIGEYRNPARCQDHRHSRRHDMHLVPNDVVSGQIVAALVPPPYVPPYFERSAGGRAGD